MTGFLNLPANTVKISKLINYLPVLGRSGVIRFTDFESETELPFIDGVVIGALPHKFSLVSLEFLNRRFVSNLYGINVPKQIEYYQKEPLWEEVDSFLIDVEELFSFLRENEFSGIIKIRNIVNHSVSYVFMEGGLVVAAESNGYKGRAVLVDIIHDLTMYHSKISVYKVSHELMALYFSLYRHIHTTTDFEQVKDIIKNLDISVVQIVSKYDTELVFDIFIDSYKPSNNDVVFFEIYNIYRLATTIPKSEYTDINRSAKMLRKFRESKPVRIRLSCPVCCSTVSMFDKICPVCGTALIPDGGVL